MKLRDNIVLPALDLEERIFFRLLNICNVDKLTVTHIDIALNF